MAVVVRKKTSAKPPTRRKIRSKVRSAGSVKRSENSAAVADLRKRLHLKQAVFARMVPVSLRSLATLESGSPPTEVVARRLIELKRLTDALSEVMREDALGTWLQVPNDAFDGLKPLEVIDRGEIDRLWAMIYCLRSGVPS